MPKQIFYIYNRLHGTGNQKANDKSRGELKTSIIRALVYIYSMYIYKYMRKKMYERVMDLRI